MTGTVIPWCRHVDRIGRGETRTRDTVLAWRKQSSTTQGRLIFNAVILISPLCKRSNEILLLGLIHKKLYFLSIWIISSHFWRVTLHKILPRGVSGFTRYHRNTIMKYIVIINSQFPDRFSPISARSTKWGWLLREDKRKGKGKIVHVTDKLCFPAHGGHVARGRKQWNICLA